MAQSSRWGRRWRKLRRCLATFDIHSRFRIIVPRSGSRNADPAEKGSGKTKGLRDHRRVRAFAQATLAVVLARQLLAAPATQLSNDASEASRLSPTPSPHPLSPVILLLGAIRARIRLDAGTPRIRSACFVQSCAPILDSASGLLLASLATA